jgi:hypothetical protein
MLGCYTERKKLRAASFWLLATGASISTLTV